MTKRELQELAALMGSEATEVDAYYMAQVMRERGYDPSDTADIEWLIWERLLDESQERMRADVVAAIRTAAESYGRKVIDAEDMRRIETGLDPLREWMRILDNAVAPGSESCLATAAWSVYDDPEHLADNIEWWTRAYAALYAANRSDDARAPEEVCEAIADGDLEGAERAAGVHHAH